VRNALSLIVAAIALAAAPAAAQDRSVWAFVLNEEPKGDIEVILTSEGPWIDPAVLIAAGLQSVPEGTRRVFPPQTTMLVSLTSLAPLVTFRLDEDQIALRLSADPSLLSATTFAISNPRPPGWQVRSNPAAFFNYSANWSTDRTSTGYGELGAHVFGTLFETSAAVDDNGAVTMGLTAVTIDQIRSRRRWVFGDTIGRSTTLGSAPVVGGFSISTQQDLDPYYVSHPVPQVRGAVRTPSTADVYVDGRLVSTIRLGPGSYTIDDLPVETGLGNARVVIRDVFGREQAFDLGFYLSTQLLKRGEHDYSYLAGWERTSIGSHVDYGRPLGTMHHNIGLADWLTVGFQAEGAEDVAMGGAGFNARVWRLGTFGAEGLFSQTAAREQGTAATGAYSFFSRLVSGDLRYTWIGPGFQNLSLQPAERAQFTVDGSFTTTLGRLGSLTLGGTVGTPDGFSARVTQTRPDFLGRVSKLDAADLSERLNSLRDRIVRIGYTVNLTSRMQVSLNATRTERPGRTVTWEGFGSITVALGWRTIASTVTSVDAAGNTLTSLNAQRSLPLGEGFGFRIDADANEPYRTQGTFEVQRRRGVIGVRADAAQDTQTVGMINVAGSIVGIGKEILLSRPVDDGFALVKVPQSRGVRVLANNQPAGRTGRRGSLFVPDLRSYLSSPIAIVQDDVPVEVKLGDVTQNVSVPYRGGAVVTFEATLIRAVTGRLDAAGTPPAYGTVTVTVEGQHFASPLNAVGEFYFEDLPPGDHAAVATWRDRSCRALVRVPKGTDPIVDIGVVACAEGPQ
jgi:outer membrane usher protein